MWTEKVVLSKEKVLVLIKDPKTKVFKKEKCFKCITPNEEEGLSSQMPSGLIKTLNSLLEGNKK
jgi:hypothetical protein